MKKQLYLYNDKTPAKTDSPIRVQDASGVVRWGRELIVRFDCHGTENTTDTDKVFIPFLESLYGSGFVMTDFNGPLFDSGPMSLMFALGVAPLVAHAANLMTLRMFMHTLARGHRGTDAGYGYPYFDRAYRSGGLRSLIARIDGYCTLALARRWRHLQDDSELDLIKPVGF